MSNPSQLPRLPGWSTKALASRLLEGPGRLFAVVNAARDEQVLMAVRGLGIERRCLYGGDEAIRFTAYAPYLLSFGATPHLLARYLDLGWFHQWGIFLRSESSAEAVASHLAGLVTVRVPGDQEAYFRFYDPWILSAFLTAVAIPQSTASWSRTPRKTPWSTNIESPRWGKGPANTAYSPRPSRSGRRTMSKKLSG